jgi:hypothetical protein
MIYTISLPKRCNDNKINRVVLKLDLVFITDQINGIIEDTNE